MKYVAEVLEWVKYDEQKTKIKTDDRGFAHLLVFTGEHVYPVIYNKWKNIFSCGSRYILHIKKYAYMPSVKTLKGLKADARDAQMRAIKIETELATKKYFGDKPTKKNNRE